MGVKTKLTLKELNLLKNTHDFLFINLEETVSGISDTVYILTDNTNKKYILKIYENSTFIEVEEEINLLKSIKDLPISKPLYLYKNYKKPMVIFSFIKGFSLENITFNSLKEIALFLKQLHLKKLEFTTKKTFDLSLLITSFKQNERVEEFTKRFKLIEELKLKNNCLIHADLFPDNVKFLENKLSGVYDFSNSCLGDKNIDLAIILISWCFDKDSNFNIEKAKAFLKTYCEKITLKELKNYLLYVCLYYALKRYIFIKEKKYKEVCYKEFLLKFDKIFSLNCT
ncbi:hypothetical protein CP985_07695 [Malaciobacter mytili LMG 24559]|uniref:Aminoglycoside phosphotransferase domain-containing protein n=1 Tax=Malaciobacter mytili LMG 24559 TaxID=1032238 RepID=A0AAX2AHH6_9BACT|nr:phosphotransferase [Malaciobacter mytili]AXH15125.1 type II homoserine kinase [Malaciobacter mytili LMG 24559]RXK15634.1 hypothetical protein CP985_07695 [Malaciobacter mytili LMG 24559]